MISCNKKTQRFSMSGDGVVIMEELMMIIERIKFHFVDELEALYANDGEDGSKASDMVDKFIMDSVAFALCTPEEQTEILRRKEHDGN